MSSREPLLELAPEDRMLLLRFVCSFAWADLEVKPSERDFVASLMRRLELDADEKRQVLGWLESPPDPDSIDPMLVPQAHRRQFLRAVEEVITVDGEVSPEERDSLVVFGQLLR